MTGDSFRVNCDIGEAFEKEIGENEVVAAARAALLAEELRGQSIELSVAVSDDTEVQRLNREYRGVDRSTDVLSFAAEEAADWSGRSGVNYDLPLVNDEDDEDEDSDEDEDGRTANFEFKLPPGMAEEADARYLGDIIISYPQAERQAPEFGNSPQREAQELIIHGVFHLLGYDHEEAEEREIMRAKEEAAAQILDKSEG